MLVEGTEVHEIGPPEGQPAGLERCRFGPGRGIARAGLSAQGSRNERLIVGGIQPESPGNSDGRVRERRCKRADGIAVRSGRAVRNQDQLARRALKGNVQGRGIAKPGRGPQYLRRETGDRPTVRAVGRERRSLGLARVVGNHHDLGCSRGVGAQTGQQSGGQVRRFGSHDDHGPGRCSGRAEQRLHRGCGSVPDLAVRLHCRGSRLADAASAATVDDTPPRRFDLGLQGVGPGPLAPSARLYSFADEMGDFGRRSGGGSLFTHM
jgi:hypothetical protein